MIADDRNKVLIGTPTKTGTHSLEAIARKAEKEDAGLRLVRWPGSKIPRHHHMLVPEGCEDYTRLLLVRDPLERLASLYHWLQKWPWQWRSRQDEFVPLDINQFAHWWVDVRDELELNGNRIPEMSQFNWWRSPNIWCVTLSECAAMFTPLFIIRLESLEDDLKGTIPGRDWGRIPHVNRSRDDGGTWFKSSTERWLKRGVLHRDLEAYYG